MMKPFKHVFLLHEIQLYALTGSFLMPLSPYISLEGFLKYYLDCAVNPRFTFLAIYGVQIILYLNALHCCFVVDLFPG